MYTLPSQQQPMNPVAAFFKGTNLVLSVFDTRRGQCDGEEAEKVLSFFPTVAPINVRTSIVGLAQAVTSFATNLTQDDSRFKSMVAENNKWVMYECEPCLWVLAVVRRSWATGSCTDVALKALLTSTYDVFVLLHGRMDTLLEQDPTGFAVRRVLQPLLDEVGSRLLPRADGAAAREPGGHASLLANPLAPHQPATVPLLATSHQTFLAVQCLVNQLLVASFYGSRLVSGVVVLWGGMPLWSTLGPQDTAALVALAARALAPAAKAAQRSRPAGAGTPMAVAGGGAAAAAGPGETAFETLLCPLQWRAGGGIHHAPPSALAAMAAGLGMPLSAGTSSGSTGASGGLPPAAVSSAGSGGFLGFGAGAGVLAAAGLSMGTPPLPVSSSAAAGPPGSGPSSFGGTGCTGGTAAGVGSALPPFLSSFLRPRLRPSMYSPAQGGGGTALALPLDSVLPMANVWLRGSNEWAQLLPYHRGQLLVLALLHDGPPPPTEVLAALAAVLGRGAGPAAAALAAEVPARSVWHEKGHRYCYTDALCHSSRYTPLKKVLTLSSAALRHLSHLRGKLDEWELNQHQHQHRQLMLLPGQGTRNGAAAGAGQVAASPGSQAQQQQEQQQEWEREREEADTQSNGAAPSPSTAGAAGSAPAQPAGPAPAALAFGGDSDAEIVVRTSHDAWLVLRAARGGRRLYTASEQGPELTLWSAVAPTDALCDRLFPGVFLQP